ncbi:MAG: precorrin-6y C5,15-methyltransferase (decarboxylating) subunit CbiE, partial [Pyramidobacter sp.]|nr:precorrin-6y C5,15-methyltransferase (decarboxylating) subunit CbiE [Pyramidobacter sp.]
VSGDTGVFSLLPLIKKRFPSDAIEVVPGISSLQTLCARLGTTWIDARIVSGHGRAFSPAQLLDAADQNAKVIFFCGPEWKPQRVSATLAEASMNDLRVTVGERLSYESERISSGTPDELSAGDYDDLALVLIENPHPWTPPCARLRDEDFIRSGVPMTREVVRSAVLDVLALERDSVLWDLGAGTGSITVAAARECTDGAVCAVEKDPEAVSLIRANCQKFHRHNVTVFDGDNLTVLPGLPRPTHIFVGGSGPELTELLARIAALGEGLLVVVSAVALKTSTEAARIMSGGKFRDFDAVHVAVTRLKTVGGTAIMAAQNPVTIFSAVTGTQKEGD